MAREPVKHSSGSFAPRDTTRRKMVRGPVRHFSSSFAPLDTTRRDETRSNLCRPLCCECAFYSHAAWQEEERQRGRICQNEEPRTRERIRSAPHFAHTRIPPCRKKNSKAIALPEMKNRAPEKGFAPHPISPQKIREWTTHGTQHMRDTKQVSHLPRRDEDARPLRFHWRLQLRK